MAQRLSYVAGIVDPHGGLRVVVTERKGDFERNHRAAGEKVFVVPDLLVPEPVPWDMIPWMIKQVELHIDWWVRTRNDPAQVERGCVAAYRKRTADNLATLARGETYSSVHIEENMR